ncbi:hypothetical protein U9M48_005441 [Paspalum notatum var. saurae]|uniref:Uncharacterized protein n=1 Tax=Paspalum notatum var. saurae TaxID=547442 RepID=A0AAQ3SJY8_PASNO
MKLVLSIFKQLSGLKIYFHKSELFLFGEAKSYKNKLLSQPEVEYFKSRFFWQSDEHKKIYILARWTTLNKPKCFGGLGNFGFKDPEQMPTESMAL